MDLLRDKVCVITGGAGSIGQATGRLFLEEGAKVMFIDVNNMVLQHCERELGTNSVILRKADVTSPTDVRDCFKEVESKWGKVDVIFSNAGNSGVIAPVTELAGDEFDAVYAVHVKGAFHVCKYGLPVMNNGGSVIITSSVAGLRGDAGAAAYVTAKHAQIGLMRSVAKEAASRKIRVNTIHPGPVANEFQSQIETNLTHVIGKDAAQFFDSLTPLGRHASPTEIAHSVLFLASSLSSFTTGTTLVVDGGMNS